jgi:hypothetical protein
MNRIFLALLLSFFILSSCGSDDANKNIASDADFNIPDSVLQEKPPQISDNSMGDLIQNISSPIEMASLIKDAGSKFSPELLASTKNVDNYATSFKRAINLGVFGADLGYLNLYEQTRFTIDYLSAIKTLSNGIHVGQFFDFKLLKDLATAGNDIDSLMFVATQSFNNIDKYLKQNNRSNISVLIITGVWVEGMYFATQINAENPTKEVADRIIEQKNVLNNLFLVLNQYKGSEEFNNMINLLSKLKEYYEPTNITYELGEPEMVEKDGVLVVEQNEKPVFSYQEKDLENIKNQIEKIRFALIN